MFLLYPFPRSLDHFITWSCYSYIMSRFLRFFNFLSSFPLVGGLSEWLRVGFVIELFTRFVRVKSPNYFQFPFVSGGSPRFTVTSFHHAFPSSLFPLSVERSPDRAFSSHLLSTPSSEAESKAVRFTWLLIPTPDSGCPCYDVAIRPSHFPFF